MARPKLPRPPRDLWIVRDRTVAALRPAGARTRTFLRLVGGLAARTVRTDLAGVTRVGRTHRLRPHCDPRRRDCFQSPAPDRPPLIRPWTAWVARLFARRLVRRWGWRFKIEVSFKQALPPRRHLRLPFPEEGHDPPPPR